MVVGSSPTTCTGTAPGGQTCDLDPLTDGTAACPAGCVEGAAAGVVLVGGTAVCGAADISGDAVASQANCEAAGACTYTPSPESCEPTIATCTGTATEQIGGVTATCDLLATTDGTARCPDGCTTTNAVTGANVVLGAGTGSYGGGGDVVLLGGSDSYGSGGDITLQPGATTSGTAGRLLLTDSAGTEVVRVAGSEVSIFGPLDLGGDVQLNDKNLETTGQISSGTMVTPALTGTTVTTVDLATNSIGATAQVSEACVATDADACSGFTAVVGDAAASQTNCEAAGACTYTAEDSTADPPVAEACEATAAAACSGAAISGDAATSSSQSICEDAGACTYTRGHTGNVDFTSTVDMGSNAFTSTGLITTNELVFNGHMSYQPRQTMATVTATVRDGTGLTAQAIADALEVDVSLIADVQSTPDEDWTFAYDANLATARFGVLEVRKSVLGRLVETCVATEAEACSNVVLDGTPATCTGAGACSYTPATTQAMCQAYARVEGDATASEQACIDASGDPSNPACAYTAYDGDASPVIEESCDAGVMMRLGLQLR